MADVDGLQLRRATPSDAEAIASLHADSWRRHYRGAYSDAFLDGDVLADRFVVWADRLREPDLLRYTLVVADDVSVIGFAHTLFDEDPSWGALLDNLHVDHRHKRCGIGSRLFATTASAIHVRGTGLYLWVQEQNVAAQRFYEASGGTRLGRALISPPGGVTNRLNGTPHKLRYAWNPQQLTRWGAEHRPH